MSFFTVARIPAWMDDAACIGLDPEIFFPDKGHSAAEARRACARCPVADQCLDFAVEGGWRTVGIWGGTNAKQRRDARVRSVA